MSRSSKAGSTSALAELRALRKSGKTRIITYESDQEDIYDEVDDDKYKEYAQNRLKEDDFVVDDKGEGYIETGGYDWEERENYSDNDMVNKPHRGKKKTRKEVIESKTKQVASLAAFLNDKAPSFKKDMVSITSNENDDALIGDLIDEITSKPSLRDSDTTTKQHSLAHTTSPIDSASKDATLANVDDILAELEDSPINRKRLSPETSRYAGISSPRSDKSSPRVKRRLVLQNSPSKQTSNVSSTLPVKKLEASMRLSDDDDEDDEEEIIVRRPTGVKYAPPSLDKAQSNPTHSDLFDDIDPLGDIEEFPEQPEQPVATDITIDTVMSDDAVLFYWMDYHESNADLFLFGKVKINDSDSVTSCMVRIYGIERSLFILPRKTGEDQGNEFSMSDVEEEVKEICQRNKITNFGRKVCHKRYAFGLEDVPAESEYLNVRYSYATSASPFQRPGRTFSRVFGTTTSLFEQFILDRDIMGPCWLKINSPEFVSTACKSWSEVELIVRDSSNLSVAPGNKTSNPPPMNIMAIGIRTVFNAKSNTREIVAVSTRTFPDLKNDTASSSEEVKSRHVTLIRPPDQIFPYGFTTVASKLSATVKRFDSERTLLNHFFALLLAEDIDIIAGHNLEKVDISLILSRCKALGVGDCNKLGRLRSGDQRHKAQHNIHDLRRAATGRLLCDLTNVFGQSLAPNCTSYELSEMCQIELGINRPAVDTDITRTPGMDTPEGLLRLIEQCARDTQYIGSLVLKTKIISLSRELTCLSGNAWTRTLAGTRSDRNESLLLHEFTRAGYVVPDKLQGNLNSNKSEGGKKDTYIGGLVFEPECGLYENYVLVMDFNSLYPSIIREFNICFTTINWAPHKQITDEDIRTLEYPSSNVEQGIFPRIIANLINKRGEVKRLLADPSKGSEIERTQWDTRQLALKLTANSMYGCLGYTKSRFYAKPLAMMITHRGREILRRTKDLATENSLQVIYGDTDSVMIHTRMKNYEQALSIGREFKTVVNKQYHHLEIDIDYVFQKLLLHAKKKYAALKVSKVDGKLKSRIEVRGLDMRRREFCQWSKDISQYCLDQLLSDDDAATSLANIRSHLTEVSDNLRHREVPLESLLIHTGLGKDPAEYGKDGNNMPSVRIALRKRSNGEPVSAGDIISYVVAESTDPKSSVADNAYTLSEMKGNSALRPDVMYYLDKQVMPVVRRLCEPLEELDNASIAECLGLNAAKYLKAQRLLGSGSNEELSRLETTISDAERFADCEALKIRCLGCSTELVYRGTMRADSDSNENNTAETPEVSFASAGGIRCPACSADIPVQTLSSQAVIFARSKIRKYYERYLICDSDSCERRTRSVSVIPNRCGGRDGLYCGDCRGKVKLEYGDKELYTQLLYLFSIFDVDRMKKNLSEQEGEMILAERNRKYLEPVRGAIGRYLDQCGRRFVNMKQLFAELNVK
ncbi:hypothetical protein CANCADRAFT_50974 [Tortispora caseinolytica NRRL Y-17796]|uniref:DNA polymerase n=1 Tax=Tortispora caseinolytica NRRL Y-17796 TaxID=767744 RepID=A0A1E4TFY1_9ASCO|nr:hypothetical protein CANCADRAFT_50974 [Tortispora caseinolytica NRRL Y-17796]